MDMRELLGLLQAYPPPRPGRTQALRGEVWPGHDLPERGLLDDPRTVYDPYWGNMGKSEPTLPPMRTLEMQQRAMTPDLSDRVPRLPTAEDMQPAFNPMLRIGGNEAAQAAQASRAGRAADLMRLRGGLYPRTEAVVLMPANIAFPTSSWPGDQGEGAGRLINCYADKEADKVTWYRSPGLSAFADVGIATPRGMLATESALYVAVEDELVSVSSAGIATLQGGNLGGSLPVTMARNNKVPTPDIVIVSDAGAFELIAGTVTTYVDADVGSPNSVSFLDAYFIFTYGDGSIIASDLNSTAINSLSTAKAEANPDGLIRGTVSGRQFYAWGPSSLEIFDNAGTSPFPLARTTVVPVGLFGQWAIAGFEDGWDLSQIFVASDGTVRRLQGYNPERISNRAVERDIQSVAVASTLRACVYTVAGNAFWVLSSPTWTWEYNATTGEWNERQSYGLTRWRGETSARAFGWWVVGDTESTSIHHIGSQWMEEAGDPLVPTAEGVMKDFPARIRVPVVDFDFTVGQGQESSQDPNVQDPNVLLSWSHDGGATWANPLWRSLGRQGQFQKQIRLFNSGRSTPQGVRFAWEVPDPVPFQFRGATVIKPIARKP